jgi:hypothetical protein
VVGVQVEAQVPSACETLSVASAGAASSGAAEQPAIAPATNVQQKNARIPLIIVFIFFLHCSIGR